MAMLSAIDASRTEAVAAAAETDDGCPYKPGDRVRWKASGREGYAVAWVGWDCAVIVRYEDNHGIMQAADANPFEIEKVEKATK